LKKHLGVWARLFRVLSVIFIIVLSVFLSVKKLDELDAHRRDQYYYCPPAKIGSNAYQICVDKLDQAPKPIPAIVFVEEFFDAVWIWFALVIMIWIISTTIKWILAGRVKKTDL
jgi:hypothetical protein